MFLGHYAAALAAKRIAPETSLGATVFAAQFLDLLWPLLLLAGVEHVEIVPGLMEASALDFVSYPISHSLLAVVLWAVLIGGGWLLASRQRRGAVVLGVLVLSHWFLDWPMHRPDLPLWPGSDVVAGGGLWASLPATLGVEFVLLAVGVTVYARTTRARDRIGSVGLWVSTVLLGVIYLGATLGPPPQDVQNLAISALGLWVLVPLMWWIDRHRQVRAVTAAAAPGPRPRPVRR